MVFESLMAFLREVLKGNIPVGIRPYWVGGSVTHFLKPQGGIRPIVVGIILRRLASKLAVRTVMPKVV
jgi:hypothetical protein